MGSLQPGRALLLIASAALGVAFAAATAAAAADDAQSQDPSGPADQTTSSDEPVEHARSHGHGMHPPLGVMAGHALEKGGLAVGYRFSFERFEGQRDATTDLNVGQVVNVYGFDVVPTRLDVKTHRIDVMYAPWSRLTLQATLPIHSMRMDNTWPAQNTFFDTESSDVGDLTFTGIVPFMRRGSQSTTFALEVGTPTGSIRKKDFTGTLEQRLPYPMQPGSGVWHLQPALTYQANASRYSWGGQASALFRLGRNDLGYRPGNEFALTGWVGGQWIEGIGSTLRLEWSRWNNVKSSDPAQQVPPLTPAGASRSQAGERVDIALGLDLHLPGLPGQSVAFEATWPIYQDLEGPQLKRDWRVQTGFRCAF